MTWAKNDSAFRASVEPLMPVDYAIGVGTFITTTRSSSGMRQS
jgi:hypothetical protein